MMRRLREESGIASNFSAFGFSNKFEKVYFGAVRWKADLLAQPPLREYQGSVQNSSRSDEHVVKGVARCLVRMNVLNTAPPEPLVLSMTTHRGRNDTFLRVPTANHCLDCSATLFSCG